MNIFVKYVKRLCCGIFCYEYNKHYRKVFHLTQGRSVSLISEKKKINMKNALNQSQQELRNKELFIISTFHKLLIAYHSFIHGMTDMKWKSVYIVRLH